MAVPRRVLLVGMMGAGKSTVCQALTKLTGWPCLDNDELVHEVSGLTTPDLLGAAGEASMRRAEREAFDATIASAPPLVAGVAAGVILDADARRLMRERAFVVYLRASIELLTSRVGDGKGRPWLGDDPLAALRALFDGREVLYNEVADLVLDVEGRTPDELAQTIMDVFREA